MGQDFFQDPVPLPRYLLKFPELPKIDHHLETRPQNINVFLGRQSIFKLEHHLNLSTSTLGLEGCCRNRPTQETPHDACSRVKRGIPGRRDPRVTEHTPPDDTP